MKKTLKAITFLLLLSLLVPAYTCTYAASGQSGYWELKGTWHTEIIPVDEHHTSNTWEANVSDGSITATMTSVNNTDANHPITYVFTYDYGFTLSPTGQSTKQKLYPGDTVNIGMTLNYIGIDPTLLSGGARIYAGAFNNYPQDNLISIVNPSGSGSKTVSIPIPSGSAQGEERYITIHCEGGYQPLEFSYIYTWVDGSGTSLKSSVSGLPQSAVSSPVSASSAPSAASSDELQPIQPDSPPAAFNSLTGTVEISPDPDSVDWEPASLKIGIPPGWHVRTSKGSSCIIQFPNMNTYIMSPETEVIYAGAPEQETKFQLVIGRLWANTKHILNGESIMETSQAVAGIKGTTYVLEDDGKTSTLKVIEGTVEFTAKATGETVTVHTGQSVSVTKARIGPIKGFDTEKETAEWEALKNGQIKQRALLWPVIVIVAVLAAAVLAFVFLRKKTITKNSSNPQAANVQHCGQCDTVIPNGDAFCPRCGTKTPQ